MSTHYVAQLKIERVDKGDAGAAAGSHRGREYKAPEPKRDISEVTMLTVKANSLDALIEKLGKHIEIIEED